MTITHFRRGARPESGPFAEVTTPTLPRHRGAGLFCRGFTRERTTMHLCLVRRRRAILTTVSLTILGAALVASAVNAQGTQEGTQGGTLLPTIYYSASATPVQPGRTGVSVTQIDAAQIENSATRSLPLLLSTQPGVSMTQSGGLGAPATLRIRGLGAGYIATRLDGIDISDPSATQLSYNFGLATTLGLDRIEVLRGSQSALHGSEAIGGVVDMATFRPESDGFSGRTAVEYGSFDTISSLGALGWAGNGTELSFTAARTISDGISAKSDNTEADGLDTAFLSYRIAHAVTDSLRIGLNGHMRDNSADFDEDGSPEGNHDETRSRAARIFAEGDWGATAHRLSYSELEIDRTSHSAMWGPYPTDGTRRELSYGGDWEQSDTLSLHWGLERSDERYSGSGAGGTARTDAVYGEALWAVTPDLDISVAARALDHDSFGQFTTGRLAAAWRPQADWVLRGALATGVTMPSPYQRFSDSGHEGLKPEQSRSLEMGAEYLWGGDNSVQLTYFDITVDDRIDYRDGAAGCDSMWGCYTQIPGETRTQGVELTGSMALSDAWRVTGNYTYTKARAHEGGTDTPLPRVPEHAFNLALEGNVTDRIAASVGLRHIAGLNDTIYGTGNVAMEDHTLVSVGGSYALNDNASLYLQVENLFDRDYETLTGYNQPGRQILVGLRTSF